MGELGQALSGDFLDLHSFAYFAFDVKLFFYSDQPVITRKPARMLGRFFKCSKM